MQIYLVRHGETDWNTKGILMGQADIPLNTTGIQQAEALRDEIAQRGLEFDAVYASPLQRTAKTAQIIAPDSPIIFSDLLKERAVGQFAGHPANELFDNKIDFLDVGLNSSAFSVEPIRAFHARAMVFLKDLAKFHSQDAKILIVTSNGFMKRLVSIITKTPPEAMPNFQNARIYHYEI